MKRGFALTLSLVLLLSLTACGGTDPPAGSGNRLLEDLQSAIGGNSGGGTGGAQAQAFENQIALSIDKTNYDKEESIEVTMDFGDVDKDNAVIVIVNSDMAHGELTPAEGKCEEYRRISDFSEIPFYLSAPDKEGLYDVRVYATGNGEELASVSFVVGNATQPTQPTVPPTEPPKDGGSVKKAFFNPPKAIYMVVREGGSAATEGTCTYALLDGNYSYAVNFDGRFDHTSAEVKTHYCRYGDGWRIDNGDGHGYGEVPEEELTYEMTQHLDTFYHDAELNGYYNNISKYYVGTETICYRNCWVYEIEKEPYTGEYKKFWIDPENGATLKYVKREDGKDGEITYEFEVTQYNLLGPIWNSNMRPDYGSVTETLYYPR